MPFEGFDVFAVGGIPQFHRAVTTGRSEHLTIGAEADLINPLCMPFEGFDFLIGADIPQFHCVVFTGRSEHLTIGAETNVKNLLSMSS